MNSTALSAACDRPCQTNCQQEPAYPGDPTVVFAMLDPGTTAHRPSKLCAIQVPHAIAECREWNA